MAAGEFSVSAKIIARGGLQVPTGATNGHVLTASGGNGTATWSAPTGGPPSGTAGGVLSGTYPSPGFAAAPIFSGLVSTVVANGSASAVSVKGAGTQANPSLMIDGSGSMYWGSGSAVADLNLYRRSAGIMHTDYTFEAGASSGFTGTVGSAAGVQVSPSGVVLMSRAGGNVVLAVTVPGDSAGAYRFLIDTNGLISWGNGGGAVDSTLYRENANHLRSPSRISTDWIMTANYGTASAAYLGLRSNGIGQGPSIAFGSSADANLYRNAAAEIATDGKFRVAGSAAGIWLVDQAAPTTTANDWLLYNNGGPLYVYRNGAAKGNFNGTSGAYTATSDEELKKNFALLKSPLAMVGRLNGRRFCWKEGDLADVGFVAQEVQKVLPEAVSPMDGGLLGVSTTPIIALLVEAVKELAGKVVTLQNQVKALMT